MFCVHCGSCLSEDAKFCTHCGRSTTDKPTPSVAATNETAETWTREIHWDYFWEYFVKGLIGFVIGVVLAFAMGSPQGFVTLGLIFAGVPYGWNLIARITGGLALYGSIVIVLLFYMLKLFLSLLIALTVYPPLLFYHLMMSQKPKSTAHIICVAIFVFSIFTSLLVIYGFAVRA